MKNNWQRKKLLDVCDFKVKKNTKSLPYVGMEDVESNTGNFLGSLEVRGVKSTTAHFDTHCVLYGKLRPYLNKVFVPDFEGHCSTEFIPLRVDKSLLNREWLAIFLRSQRIVKELSKNVTGARMPRVSLDFIKNLEIPLPPLEEQKKIVERLWNKCWGIYGRRKSSIRKPSKTPPNSSLPNSLACLKRGRSGDGRRRSWGMIQF